MKTSSLVRAYLRELHDRYGTPGFVAAYNAGPARWENHFASGKPLPLDTRAYPNQLASVVGGDATDDAFLLTLIARSWTKASLFVTHATDSASGKQATSDLPSSRSMSSRSARNWTVVALQSQELVVPLSARGPRL